jgi:hypothetical protein
MQHTVAQGWWWVAKDGGDRQGSRGRSTSIDTWTGSHSHAARSPTVEACASRFMVRRLLLALVGARAAVSHRTVAGMLVAQGAAGTVSNPSSSAPPARPPAFSRYPLREGSSRYAPPLRIRRRRAPWARPGWRAGASAQRALGSAIQSRLR